MLVRLFFVVRSDPYLLDSMVCPTTTDPGFSWLMKVLFPTPVTPITRMIPSFSVVSAMVAAGGATSCSDMMRRINWGFAIMRRTLIVRCINGQYLLA